MNLQQLRQQAKSLGLIRYSKLRKASLQQLIERRLQKQEIPLNHLHSKFILKTLIKKPAWEWEVSELEALSGTYLEALSMLMGVPKSGTKARKIERLLAVASVREKLKDFANPETQEDAQSLAQEVASSFKGAELKALCKKAGVFAPSTKYGMSASLLNWRKACNRRGLEVAQQYRKAA